MIQVPPVPADTPDLTEMAMSAVDRHRHTVLGVVAKRTYLVEPSGRCTVAPNQSPLNFGPVEDPEHDELILADLDVVLDKLETDVVVRGHAWNHAQAPSYECMVNVGHQQPKRLRVFGDRRCVTTSTGRLAFSEPTRVDKVPLSYRYAYGGCDERGEREGGFELQAMAEQFPPDRRERMLSAASPWRYPRNRAGRGYIVEEHPEAIEAVELPNLEDPVDLLTPERLIVGNPWYWPIQPLPAGLGWLEYGAFPRIGWFGHTPEWDDEDLMEYVDSFAEVRRGYADRRIFLHDDNLYEIPRKFDRRALNGASLGLRFPYLGGSETIALTNLHPEFPHWTVQLPRQVPTLWVDDRAGGLTQLRARLYTVQIEPDEDRVTVVWAGHTRARRAYFEHELLSMPKLVEW